MSQPVTGAAGLLDLLERYNITCLFTSPIAALAPLWEAFAKRNTTTASPRLQYYNCRHELLAVGLAIGHYKATGQMQAVVLPTGLGVLNGSMALRTAMQERIPLLVISPDTRDYGQQGPETPDPGPEWPTFLIDRHGPARHADSVTKASFACHRASDLLQSVHRAIFSAQQTPRGPTCVEIPFELLMSRDIKPCNWSVLNSVATGASHEAIYQVVESIRRSKRPIIVTEHGGDNLASTGELFNLAERVAAPVFEWWMPAYHNFPRSHPLWGNGEVECYLPEADLVLVIGANGPWHPPDLKLANGCQVVVIEQDPLRSRSSFWGYQTDLCLPGDIRANLAAINRGLQCCVTNRDRLEEWSQRNANDMLKFLEQANSDAISAEEKGQLHAYHFFLALRKVLPKSAVIVDEMVSQIPYYIRVLFTDPEKPFLQIRGWQGGLGTGLSVALGAKTATGDRMVVAIIGDGAFNYNPVLACLGFAQQNRLPILCLIMNNNGYQSQTWNLHKYFPGGAAVMNRDYYGSVISPTPEYTRLAEAFDMTGRTIETPDTVLSILEESVELVAGGTSVIVDVKITP